MKKPLETNHLLPTFLKSPFCDRHQSTQNQKWESFYRRNPSNFSILVSHAGTVHGKGAGCAFFRFHSTRVPSWRVGAIVVSRRRVPVDFHQILVHWPYIYLSISSQHIYVYRPRLIALSLFILLQIEALTPTPPTPHLTTREAIPSHQSSDRGLCD